MTNFAEINQVVYVATMLSMLFIFWQPCVSVKLLYDLQVIILDR